MRRGFETEAERLADRTRAELGLQPHVHMPIRDLAAHLGIEIYPADQLVDPADLKELDELQPCVFSAATFHLSSGRTVIVSNPFSEPGRTNSDIAHEIAHLLLNYEIREIQQLAAHTFFTCNPEQEEEANCLAGCLLLLREAFTDPDPVVIANKHHVSVPMARFRLNASGVLLQVQRARASRSQRR